jgi:hypothetical protein
VARFSTESTIQLPRLLLALGVVIVATTAVSFAAAGGPFPSVLLPIAVVGGLGLYINGVRRYDLLDDRLRIIGLIGQRDVSFDKITEFEAEPVSSFYASFQSILTGAPIDSGIKAEGGSSLFVSELVVWAADRDGFLREAQAAVAAWQANRTAD